MMTRAYIRQDDKKLMVQLAPGRFVEASLLGWALNKEAWAATLNIPQGISMHAQAAFIQAKEEYDE
jgi:hypothetical protein